MKGTSFQFALSPQKQLLKHSITHNNTYNIPEMLINVRNSL